MYLDFLFLYALSKRWVWVKKFLTRVGLGRINFLLFWLGQSSLVWVWIWKISPKNHIYFNFFPFGSKKISSGRVKDGPGQKYGRVRAHLYSKQSQVQSVEPAILT